MNAAKIDGIIRSTQGAWFEDGIWEIGFGLATSLVAGYYWLAAALRLESIAGMWFAVIQVAVFFVAFGSVRWVVGALKKRHAFPRTGYVAYKKRSPKARARRLALSALTSLGMAAAVVALCQVAEERVVVPLLVACATASSVAYVGIRYRRLRFLLLAAATLTTGAVLAFLALEMLLGVSIFMTAVGLCTAVSGLAALCSFVRTNPVASEQDLETVP